MMATALTVQTMFNENGGLRKANVVWTAADDTGMTFVNSGNERVLIKNLHSAPLTVVFVAVADQDNRLGDGSISVATTNAEESVTGYFRQSLFNDASGLVNITIVTDTALWIAVVRGR